MKNRDLKLGDFSGLEGDIGLEGDRGLEGGLDFGDFFCPLPHNPTAVVSFVLIILGFTCFLKVLFNFFCLDIF